MQINARLVQEQEAALAAAASQQKKTRCCRKCGQPMKGTQEIDVHILILNELKHALNITF
jgi:hypothetical protein